MPSPTLRERLDPRRFFRGRKAAVHAVVLTHRRVFILPNRRGLGLALLLFIQWLAAINYNNNLAFILTFLLAGVAMAGILHGYRNLAGLRLKPGRETPVFAGEEARFELIVENPTPLDRYGVYLRLGKNGRPLRLDLPAETTVAAALPLAAERRGWLVPGTVTVFTEFPLGLFRAWAPLDFTSRILVYPKPAAERLPFPEAAGEGQARQRRHGAEDFHGFLAYQPGDPLRHLHWKGVAKGHAPQVKQYAGAEADNLHFDFEETPGADTERRLGRLCRWVLDAENLGLRYALSLPGARIATASGAEHCRRCLETLALFGT